jgi:hypothetical protein
MMGRTAKTVLRHSRQQVRTPRKVCPLHFEADHIGGRNHIPQITVDECQPDHAQLTELRLAAGADMNKQPHLIKTVEMALRSLAVTGHAIASAIHKLCAGLEFCAEKLKWFYETSVHTRRKSKNRQRRKLHH